MSTKPEQKYSSAKVIHTTIALQAVAISDLTKILNFIGETLGIEYDVDNSVTTPNGEKDLVDLEINGYKSEEETENE